MERWKGIEGYEEQYQISDYGRIRNIQTGVMRKSSLINSGYLIFQLRGRPNRHRELVHRLVAQHFCKGYSPELEVNHIDGDKLNNYYKNLEWVTRKQNIHHNITRGVFDVVTAQKVAKVKNQKPVAQYTLEGEYIRSYPSAKAASKVVGINIKRAAAGTRKSSAGYKWKYL